MVNKIYVLWVVLVYFLVIVFFFIKKFRKRLLLFCVIFLNVCFFVNECFKGVDLDSVIIKDMYKML